MDVLRPEAVFVAILEEPLARINHKDTGAVVSVLLVNYDNAGGDAGAVKEIWR